MKTGPNVTQEVSTAERQARRLPKQKSIIQLEMRIYRTVKTITIKVYELNTRDWRTRLGTVVEWVLRRSMDRSAKGRWRTIEYSWYVSDS